VFYCDPCGVKNGWPDSILRSRGRCEVCGAEASCNDVHHSLLPEPRKPELKLVPMPETPVTPESPRRRRPERK
jgi:hypothetical protein